MPKDHAERYDLDHMRHTCSPGSVAAFSEIEARHQCARTPIPLLGGKLDITQNVQRLLPCPALRKAAGQSGAFHKLLDTWPLEGEGRPFVRLYREGEGITALVASSSQVRLFFFDTQGSLQEEQVLLNDPLDIDRCVGFVQSWQNGADLRVVFVVWRTQGIC